MFQSLLGFPMRCDCRSVGGLELMITSFNPYWVFQCAATRPLIAVVVAFPKHSFNPYWVFQCAATHPAHPGGGGGFNPYWVFQCAATKCPKCGSRKIKFVSIPIGFSNALRHYVQFHATQLCSMFQSLLGFPMRCDGFSCDPLQLGRQSFNPYWVFQCAAT